MGFRKGMFWRGLMTRTEVEIATERKPVVESNKFPGPRRTVNKLLGRHKARQIDSQGGEPSPLQGAIHQDDSGSKATIVNVTLLRVDLGLDGGLTEALKPSVSTQGEHKRSLDQLGLEHETEPNVSLAAGIDNNQDDADAGAIPNQLDLRQMYAAQSPIIPRKLQPRRLRFHSADVALWELEEQDISDPTSNSSDQTDWKLLAETLERSRQDDIDELEEKSLALQVSHQEEIKAANSKKVVLQKRVKKLLEQKAELENDLKLIKEESIASLEFSQGKFDRLQETHLDLLAESSRDREQMKDLREDNIRLCNLIASLDQEKKESSDMVRLAREETQQISGELAQSREKNLLVGQNLQKACREADFYRNRAYAINYALEQQPGKYADFDHEIKLRDQRFSDLEVKAAKCFAALTELEKSSTEDRKTARDKVLALQTQLGEQEIDMAWLEASKSLFQTRSEEILGMLSDRIVPSDLSHAMNEYFQLVIQDNGVLKEKIQNQVLAISQNEDQVELLRSEIGGLKKQSLLDHETQANLEEKIRAQDIEIGRLEFKVDCVKEKHAQEMGAKDSALATLQTINDRQSQEAAILAQAADPSSIHRLVQSKDQEISALYVELNKLWAEKCALEQNELALNAARGLEMEANCFIDREIEELKIRLRDADEELQNLRRRVSG